MIAPPFRDIPNIVATIEDDPGSRSQGLYGQIGPFEPRTWVTPPHGGQHLVVHFLGISVGGRDQSLKWSTLMIEDHLDRGRWYRRYDEGLRIRKSAGGRISKGRKVFVVEFSVERAITKWCLDIFLDRFQDSDAGKPRPDPSIFQLLNDPPRTHANEYQLVIR